MSCEIVVDGEAALCVERWVCGRLHITAVNAYLSARPKINSWNKNFVYRVGQFRLNK